MFSFMHENSSNMKLSHKKKKKQGSANSAETKKQLPAIRRIDQTLKYSRRLLKVFFKGRSVEVRPVSLSHRQKSTET